MKMLLATALVGASWASAHAQNVQLPHTFESGTPALASEVNANFDALLEGVNSNYAAIGALSGASLEPAGTLQILHPDYAEPIEIVGFVWSSALETGGAVVQLPQFGPLVVIKKVDARSPTLFLDYAAGQLFSEITVELTAPDGTVRSYFATHPVISRFDTITAGDGVMLDRLSFADYELVQVKVTDAATGAETIGCWNVATNSQC